HDVTLLPRNTTVKRQKCHPCVRNTVLPISQEGQSDSFQSTYEEAISHSRTSTGELLSTDNRSERVLSLHLMWTSANYSLRRAGSKCTQLAHKQVSSVMSGGAATTCMCSGRCSRRSSVLIRAS